MKAKIFLLSLALGFGGTGCTLTKIAPMIPEIMDGYSRTRSSELDQAYSYIDEGKFERADAVLKHLERENPTPLLISEIAYMRALITERQGSVDEALVQYQAVIANHPHTPDAYFAAKKIQHLEATRKATSTP